jgi:hypothetical protein
MGWILITLASFCAFMVGLNYGRREQFKAIEATINYMIDNGYVKSRSNGIDTELIPLNEN